MNSTLASKYEYLVARALQSEDGRLALATMMIQPIRRGLDYLGICRKVFQVDYIPDGVFPVYEKDIDAVARFVPARGELSVPQIEGDQVALETFIIGVNPEILRTTVRKRRFNVINRIQARSRATIQEEEDNYLMELLESAFTDNNPNGNTDVAPFSTPYSGATFTGDLHRDPIATAYAEMRSRDVFPTKIIINPLLAKGFLLWDNKDFDPITQHQVLKTGLFGKLWGMDIYMTKLAPKDKFFLVAEPEFLGVMPIRQDVDVLDTPNNRELKLGWSIYEEIGFGLLNNSGVNMVEQTP